MPSPSVTFRVSSVALLLCLFAAITTADDQPFPTPPNSQDATITPLTPDAALKTIRPTPGHKATPFPPAPPLPQPASAARAEPGSRERCTDLKVGRFVAKPKMEGFVAAYAKAWGKGGRLEKRGLVPFSAADAQGATAQSTALKPLDPAGLK